jgi:hypothetical protein
MECREFAQLRVLDFGFRISELGAQGLGEFPCRSAVQQGDMAMVIYRG